MKRRSFLKKGAITATAALAAPYILPSGRLFAATGTRIANHVVFVIFGGGLRNQETIKQQYVSNQSGQSAVGNVMPNMLSGSAPSGSLIYNTISPLLSTPLSKQGTLFRELRYSKGPTGHFNGHTVAVTGQYTETGLNLNVNPDHPTVFEYYRKHNSPQMSALNAWWISNGLGPYPSLNFSKHGEYGAQFGANFISPPTTFGANAYANIFAPGAFHPEERDRVNQLKGFLDNNFSRSAAALSGVNNTDQDRELYKSFVQTTIDKVTKGQITFPLALNQINSDLYNAIFSVEVLKEFEPELTVINMTSSDVCHNNFSGYIDNLHKADFAMGYIWDEIQKIPGMAGDTVIIAMPEHGRNQMPNTLADNNGLLAFDHTSDQNSREIFAMMCGKGVKSNLEFSFDAQNNPIGESVDIVPTIAKILGFYDDIPLGMLEGRPLTEAFL